MRPAATPASRSSMRWRRETLESPVRAAPGAVGIDQQIAVRRIVTLRRTSRTLEPQREARVDEAPVEPIDGGVIVARERDAEPSDRVVQPRAQPIDRRRLRLVDVLRQSIDPHGPPARDVGRNRTAKQLREILDPRARYVEQRLEQEMQQQIVA